MPAERYYYSDSITDFINRNEDEIVGILSRASTHDINAKSTNAWVDEIQAMKVSLEGYAGRGSVFFEYNIPRMGKRADVIALIDNIVFVIEFKTENKSELSREAVRQVWDYALDLKNFQEGSLQRIIIPILVASKAKVKKCRLDMLPFEDNVYTPLLSNNAQLSQCFSQVITKLSPIQDFSLDVDTHWARSGYSPTPTIIEAAIALYQHHTVDEITKHDADLAAAFACINRIIEHCKNNHRKAIQIMIPTAATSPTTSRAMILLRSLSLLAIQATLFFMLAISSTLRFSLST